MPGIGLAAGKSVVNKIDVISLVEFIVFTDCFTDKEAAAQIGDCQRLLTE